MRQKIKALKHWLKSNRTYLPASVLRYALYALRRETRAFKRWWQSYPAYIAALVLIVAVVWFGSDFVVKEKRQVENVRLQLTAQSRFHEEKLERKQQRLAAALSHLEDNPKLE